MKPIHRDEAGPILMPYLERLPEFLAVLREAYWREVDRQSPPIAD